MAITNTAKNSATPTNTAKVSTTILWDAAGITWDQPGVKWDGVLYDTVTNTSKNSATPTNSPKS